jgi:hypothetical protein
MLAIILGSFRNLGLEAGLHFRSKLAEGVKGVVPRFCGFERISRIFCNYSAHQSDRILQDKPLYSLVTGLLQKLVFTTHTGVCGLGLCPRSQTNVTRERQNPNLQNVSRHKNPVYPAQPIKKNALPAADRRCVWASC